MYTLINAKLWWKRKSRHFRQIKLPAGKVYRNKRTAIFDEMCSIFGYCGNCGHLLTPLDVGHMCKGCHCLIKRKENK